MIAVGVFQRKGEGGGTALSGYALLEDTANGRAAALPGKSCREECAR